MIAVVSSLASLLYNSQQMMASALRRVVITRRLPASALRHLSRPDIIVDMWDSDEPMPRAELMKAVSDARGTHGLVCMLTEAVDKPLIEAASGLKVVSTMSVGYSHIDVNKCKEASIRIGYTPGVLTNATADLAVTLALATARRIPQAEKAVRSGEWTSWKPFWLTGKSVFGSTVGVIGLGRIGSAVARRFTGFDCKILYTGRSGVKPDFERECPRSEYADMDTLLRNSDFVIVVCALTPETRNMINYEKLSIMKPDAVFVNIARGEVVVQDDLIRILKERPTFSAGLDVTVPEPLPTDSGLLSCSNCVVLPHIGSATEACREKMAEITILNALNVLDGKDMISELTI